MTWLQLWFYVWVLGSMQWHHHALGHKKDSGNMKTCLHTLNKELFSCDIWNGYNYMHVTNVIAIKLIVIRNLQHHKMQTYPGMNPIKFWFFTLIKIFFYDIPNMGKILFSGLNREIITLLIWISVLFVWFQDWIAI